MQFEHFSAIAVKANALLLCVKILQQDMDKFLMRTTSDVAPVSKVTPSPQISGGAYGIPPHALRAQLAAREKQREEAIERAASAGAVQSSLPAGERIYGPECRFFRFVSEIKRDTHYLHHKFKPTHTRPLPSLAGTEIRSESDLFDAAIRELSGHVDRHASPSEDITHLEVGTSLRELATSTADQSTKDEDTDEAVADKDSHKMPLRRQQFTQSPAQLRQTELARRGLSPDTVVAESTPSPPPSTASIRLPVVAQKAASSSKGTDTTQSLRNYITVLNILRVIQKLTKNKADRVRLLVQFKAHSVFRTLIRIDNEAINIYALKVLKSMLTYLPRKWRNSNMLVVTGIYLRLGSTLKDHWTITDPDLQPPPHTLQQAALLAEQIATFNRYHYEEEDTYSEATGSLWATIETDGYVDRIESRLCSSLQASGDDTIWNNPTGVVHEWEFELWMRREGVFLLFGS
ncbi:hypothetical protein SARC_00008 [Sphaeroforma arctica JP610]|uniref:Far11/STRP C-terminal domain-containing protein n=1 Tax=Sphaeroforma arctica JP610 TaxID=667725 RepID=A0A0L0GG77_9EUKA|nr:hypothetical protein SARC_00008 [Sphaeroforma arctica JP610]KNC87874.1 hypothetical protein SARC_00008 [Sphaeroforma arctica JP610]|eukprot:XP_014161776.1 hypothetical protein SARC_00008 [Sphaeroforma arctica JP610]